MWCGVCCVRVVWCVYVCYVSGLRVCVCCVCVAYVCVVGAYVVCACGVCVGCGVCGVCICV